jgi:hypothetical protein
MPVKNSPSGAIFPYYYKDGELFGCHMESYAADEVGAMAMMKAETKFILKQNCKMGFWINFYGTNLSGPMIAGLADMLAQIRPKVTKLGLVGCSWLSQWKIKRQLKKMEALFGLPVRFYRDPEDAKAWLVSEGE